MNEELKLLSDKLDTLAAQIDAQNQRYARLEALLGEFMPIFDQSGIRSLDELHSLDQKGYFAFLRGWRYVINQIVDEFDEEEVCRLGDSIVTILATIRNMTQPEIMVATNELIHAVRETPPVEDNVSTWRLLRELNDPQVRRGVVRVLKLVKTLADQPEPVEN